MASMGYHVIYKKPGPSRSSMWILAALPQHACHSRRTHRDWHSSMKVESVHGLRRLRYSRHATRTRPIRLTPWSPCGSQAMARTEAQESTTRSAKRQERELSVALAVMGDQASLFSWITCLTLYALRPCQRRASSTRGATMSIVHLQNVEIINSHARFSGTSCLLTQTHTYSRSRLSVSRLWRMTLSGS